MTVIIAPRVASLLHLWFRANWRVFEPSRHLQTFDADNLAALAKLAVSREVPFRAHFASKAASLIRHETLIAVHQIAPLATTRD